MSTIYSKGDWLLTRSYAQGATLGKLAKNWGGEQQICFSEAYHVRTFTVEDSAEGNLATLSWQKPKKAEVFGGRPAVLNESCLAWLLDDEQANAILKFAETKDKK